MLMFFLKLGGMAKNMLTVSKIINFINAYPAVFKMKFNLPKKNHIKPKKMALFMLLYRLQTTDYSLQKITMN